MKKERLIQLHATGQEPRTGHPPAASGRVTSWRVASQQGGVQEGESTWQHRREEPGEGDLAALYSASHESQPGPPEPPKSPQRAAPVTSSPALAPALQVSIAFPSHMEDQVAASDLWGHTPAVASHSTGLFLEVPLFLQHTVLGPAGPGETGRAPRFPSFRCTRLQAVSSACLFYNTLLICLVH